MNLRIAMTVILLAGAQSGYAQAAQEAPASPDGAKPSDGAITGGSIKRGGGAGTEGATPGIGAETSSEEAVKRCNEMTGTLREQCLLQEKGAGAGGTRAPASGPEERKADPRAAPPPQNPR
jgi:hypothetical protein